MLRGHRRVELTTEPGGKLRLAIAGWLQARARAVVVRVAGAVRDATAATTTPSRPVLDARPLLDAGAAEVAASTLTRSVRLAGQRLMFGVGFTCVARAARS